MARGRYNKNRGRGGGRGGRGGGGGHRSYQDNRQSFQDVMKKNDKFERYYNALDIVPAGAEREAFWTSLRRELPNSFRFTGSKGHALSVRNNLTTRFFPLIGQIQHDGKPVELPKRIPWYPDGLAYSMTTPKNVVRKYEPFKEFQKFLVSETSVGNISRQEHVSMIPPLLLDVKPNHAVLDLCAAPGSKSAQLIEAIHAGEEDRVERAIAMAKGGLSTNGVSLHDVPTKDYGRTTGLLVANDVNYQRAQMLVHQVKRLNSPNLIVTNHDATMFPSIALPTSETTPGQVRRGKYLKFDRILADVPCSGDGTCRKNPSIWKDWTPQNGLGLYITQVRILTRALQLLKSGGRVVYSTCSMNPVENEAVVSSAIERCGGSTKVRLLNMNDHLPALIRNHGLEDWSIMARDGKIYESWPEAQQYEDQETSKIVPGMFSPGPEEKIPLKNCMRVYPHQQDTGGFFIAVLEKVSEIRAKPEADSKCANSDWVFLEPEEPATVGGAPFQKPTLVGELLNEIEHPHPPVETEGDFSSAAARQNEDIPPASPSGKRRALEDTAGDDEAVAKRLKVNDETEQDSIAFDRSTRPLPPSLQLGVEATEANGHVEESPGPDRSELQPPQRRRHRDNEPANEEAFKFISSSHPELETIFTFYELHPAFPRDRFLVRNPAGDPVKGIYYSSQLVKDILQANEGRGMKFVHGGVKMFVKQDVQGQEGVCRWRIQTEGLPIVEGWVGEDRTVRLYKRTTLRKLLVEMFPKIGAEDSPEGEGWKALGEIGERVLKIGMGCCVLRVMANSDDGGFEEGFTLPLWRSLHSLNLMLPKDERKAMLLRIFEEDVELINHHEQQKKDQQDQRPSNEQSSTKGGEKVQRRTDTATGDDGGVVLEAPPSPLEPELALAAEHNLLGEEDKEEATKLQALEGEDRKISDAMPERKGESDEMDTTV